MNLPAGLPAEGRQAGAELKKLYCRFTIHIMAVQLGISSDS